jgi:hypothetical protein
MPLFETASSTAHVRAEALINIPPGIYNNLFEGDVVFVAFEENALEQPVILGKLFTGTTKEESTPGGAGIFDTLKANSAATIPSSTLFVFPDSVKSEYEDLKTPKKMADYIKWIEKFFKNLINQLDGHFRCFKNWVQWQLHPENMEIDDGDIDTGYHVTEAYLYQEEGSECKICSQCTRDNTRSYLAPSTDKNYPKM